MGQIVNRVEIVRRSLPPTMLHTFGFQLGDMEWCATMQVANWIWKGQSIDLWKLHFSKRKVV